MAEPGLKAITFSSTIRPLLSLYLQLYVFSLIPYIISNLLIIIFHVTKKHLPETRLQYRRNLRQVLLLYSSEYLLGRTTANPCNAEPDGLCRTMLSCAHIERPARSHAFLDCFFVMVQSNSLFTTFHSGCSLFTQSQTESVCHLARVCPRQLHPTVT